MPRKRRRFNGSPTIHDIVEAYMRAAKMQEMANTMTENFERRVQAKVVIHHRKVKGRPKTATISLDVPSRASKKSSPLKGKKR